MNDTTTWRMAAPAVISETIEGEAIIVNLDSGAYYSLDGAGAVVWMAAQAGATLPQMIALAHVRFSGAPAEITAGVTALVEELIAEGLLVPSATVAAAPEPGGVLEGGRAAFVKPVLQKYTDMADLLLLDPIHEVDEQGWPHPAPRN